VDQNKLDHSLAVILAKLLNSCGPWFAYLYSGSNDKSLHEDPAWLNTQSRGWPRGWFWPCSIYGPYSCSAEFLPAKPNTPFSRWPWAMARSLHGRGQLGEPLLGD
jgi:hypothetical protein